jgi:16S rRNA G966 N2-methylase RsmD
MSKSQTSGTTFFEQHPLFLETSETTNDPRKLEARYQALIIANKELIEGKTILDLASHDGRWSFAALKNGASFVYGIEWKERLIEKTMSNMAAYNVDKAKYRFVNGDIFAEIEKIDRTIDCIFVFGIFYHIVNHMLLLEKLSATGAKHIIIDTNTSRLQEPVIELRKEGKRGKALVGHPSKAGVEKMLSYFGWTPREFDWAGSGLIEDFNYLHYRTGRRITIVGSR